MYVDYITYNIFFDKITSHLSNVLWIQTNNHTNETYMCGAKRK